MLDKICNNDMTFMEVTNLFLILRFQVDSTRGIPAWHYKLSPKPMTGAVVGSKAESTSVVLLYGYYVKFAPKYLYLYS